MDLAEESGDKCGMDLAEDNCGMDLAEESGTSVVWT